MLEELVGVAIAAIAFSLICAVWTSTDAMNRNMHLEGRQLWFLIVLVFPVLGLLLYLAIGRPQPGAVSE